MSRFLLMNGGAAVLWIVFVFLTQRSTALSGAATGAGGLRRLLRSEDLTEYGAGHQLSSEAQLDRTASGSASKRTCWLRSPECVPHFIFDGKRRSGCMRLELSEVRMCSKHSFYSGQDSRWDECRRGVDSQCDSELYSPDDDTVPFWDADAPRSVFNGAGPIEETPLNNTTNATFRCQTIGTFGVGAGSLCIFPFLHDGVQYDGCTRVGRAFRWCATKVDMWGVSVKSSLGECSDTCPDQGRQACSTVGKAGVGAGKACVFPFIFGDKQHHRCTFQNHTAQWCATEVDSFGLAVPGKWGECSNSCMRTVSAEELCLSTYSKEQCLAVGCCKFTTREECQSAVGSEPCAASLNVSFTIDHVRAIRMNASGREDLVGSLKVAVGTLAGLSNLEDLSLGLDMKIKANPIQHVSVLEERASRSRSRRLSSVDPAGPDHEWIFAGDTCEADRGVAAVASDLIFEKGAKCSNEFMRLDGSVDYASFPVSGDLPTSITVQARVKVLNAKQFSCVFSLGALHLGPTASLDLAFEHPKASLLTFPGFFQKDVWATVVVTCDATLGTATVYKDGILFTQQGNTSCAILSGESQGFWGRCGAEAAATGGYLDGTISYARVWSRSLSQNEVMRLRPPVTTLPIESCKASSNLVGYTCERAYQGTIGDGWRFGGSDPSWIVLMLTRKSLVDGLSVLFHVADGSQLITDFTIEVRKRGFFKSVTGMRFANLVKKGRIQNNQVSSTGQEDISVRFPAIVDVEALKIIIVGAANYNTNGSISDIFILNPTLNEDETKVCATTGTKGVGRGRLCVFPFRYRGVLYDHCVQDNDTSPFPWCATEVRTNVTKVIGRWGDTNKTVEMVPGQWGVCSTSCEGVNAAPKSCATVSAGGAKREKECVFPFVYNGRKYSTCTDVDSTQPWCATGVDFEGNMLSQQWGACAEQCEGVPKAVGPVERVCATVGDEGMGSGHPCVFPFVYNGINFTSCARADSALRYWCATQVDSFGSMAPHNWGLCGPGCKRAPETLVSLGSVFTPTPKCSTEGSMGDGPGHDCVFPFKYHGFQYNGCTDHDSFIGPWCPTQLNETGEALASRWGICNSECPTNARKSLEACITVGPMGVGAGHKCIFPFSYLGKQYTECTFVDGTEAWCATAVDEIGDMLLGSWGKCADACPTSWDDMPIKAVQKKPCVTKGSEGVGADYKCIFPFSHKGVHYDSCTLVDHVEMWCPTEVDQHGVAVPGQWGFCADSCQAELESVRGRAKACITQGTAGVGALQPCVFPFRYRGTVYNGCSTADSVDPWCATKIDSNGSMIHGQWGVCSPACDELQSSCVAVSDEGRVSCVFPFIFEDRQYNGCATNGSLVDSWCPTEVDSAGNAVLDRIGKCSLGCSIDEHPVQPPSVKYANATIEVRATMYFRANDEDFVLRGLEDPDVAEPLRDVAMFFDGFKHDDRDRAIVVSGFEIHGSRRRPQTRGDLGITSKCWQLSDACVPGFQYGQHRVTGCAELYPGKPICSRDRLYSGVVEPCSHVACEDCWQPAHECVPEFSYNNQSYKGCTKVNADRHWCSLDKVFVSDTGRFAPCTPCQQEPYRSQECVQKHPDCVDSFVYQGREYYGCTKEGNSKYWCSTNSYFVEGVTKWEECVPCDDVGTSLSCTTVGDQGMGSGRSCVFPFVFENQIYTGCTSVGKDKPWCATMVNDDGVMYDAFWGFCSTSCTHNQQLLKLLLSSCTTTGNVGIGPGFGCVFPFVYKEREYHSCATVDSVKPWCATDVDSKGRVTKGNFGLCSNSCDAVANKSSMCMTIGTEGAGAGRACVIPFIYKGKTYTKCTRDGHTRPWCATAIYENGTMVEDEWGACSQVCETFTSNECTTIGHLGVGQGHTCKFPFWYDDRRYDRCTNIDSTHFWCATELEAETRRMVPGRWGSCPSTCLQQTLASLDQTNDDFSPVLLPPADCSTVGNAGAGAGKKCVFPFSYRGTYYDRCTSVEKGQPWCATNLDLLGRVKENAWGFCADSCPSDTGTCRTVGTDGVGAGHKCVFPFSYEGQQYDACTEDPSGKKMWCATAVDSNGAMVTGQWGVCESDCQKARKKTDDMCYRPSGRCVANFAYQGTLHSGCVTLLEFSEDPICSRNTTLVDDSSWDDCKRVPCKECWLTHPQCVSRFELDGQIVEGCKESPRSIAAGAFEPAWCSHDEVFTPRSKKSACSPCMAETKLVTSPQQCFEPHGECVPEFTYRGRVYRGCTNEGVDGPGHFWCSKDQNYDRHERQEPCRKVDCEHCFIKPATCAESFVYKNETISGCTKKDSDVPWCSLNSDFKQGQITECAQCPNQVLAPQKGYPGRCLQMHGKCVTEFTYQGDSHAGCMSFGDSGERYCSTKRSLSSLSNIEECTTVDCEECYMLAPGCQSTWTDEASNVTYRGCSRLNADHWWCSKDEVYRRGSGSALRCLPCDYLGTKTNEMDAISACEGLGYDEQECNAVGCCQWTDENICRSKIGSEPCSQGRFCYRKHPKCVDSFQYKGKTITGCTLQGFGQSWCSETMNFDLGQRYQLCEPYDCEDDDPSLVVDNSTNSTEALSSTCWTPDDDCVPIWSYNGDTYKGCTDKYSSDGRSWCSTVASYNTNVKTNGQANFRYCTHCASTSIATPNQCWKVADDCVQPFSFDGELATGCIYSIELGKSWCSKRYVLNSGDAADFADGRSWCIPIPCKHQCSQPTPGCVMEFKHHGRQYHGCIEAPSAKFHDVTALSLSSPATWCPTEKEPDAGSFNSWQQCKQVDCRDLCYAPPATCTIPFTFNGRVHGRCITEGREAPWCSEVPFLANGSSAWRYCEPVACKDVCYKPAPDCLDNFFFMGKVISGCVDSGDVAWCSAERDQPSLAFTSTSMRICEQVDCSDVCWGRDKTCKQSFSYKGRVMNGCVTDPNLLQGKTPWCSQVDDFNDSSTAWRSCAQIDCDDQECIGPQCDGFGLLKLVDGKCLRPLNITENVSAPLGTLTVSRECGFPDKQTLMVREMPSETPGFFYLQDYSGRCVRPEVALIKPGTRLIIRDKCLPGDDYIKFRRVTEQRFGRSFQRLVHFSGRCVDISSSSPVEVILKDLCTDLKPYEAQATGVVKIQMMSEGPQFVSSRGVMVELDPAPCVWAEWSNWTDCTVSCGLGKKVRTRDYVQPARHDGRRCRGPKLETVSCDASCPQHCVLGDWGLWGPCQASCGGGVRLRSREIYVTALYGGRPCEVPEEVSACNTQACAVDCERSEWSEWSPCSQTCGGVGTSFRQQVVTRSPRHGGKECGLTPMETMTCNSAPCPIDCSLGSWGDWGTCSKECGGGTSTRSRQIIKVAKYGGKECSVVPSLSRDCNEFPCPVDCTLDPWLDWSPCTKSCDAGTRYRSRQIVPEMYGGQFCKDTKVDEEQICNDITCDVNCVWDSWADWSECPVDCGGGKQYRSRGERIAVEGNGTKCLGSSVEETLCGTQSCPIDCRYNEWGEWSYCHVSCGGGISVRYRELDRKAAYDGKECQGAAEDQRPCNAKPCPVDCVWGSWSSFTSCSRSCDGGWKSRTRNRLTQRANGGVQCSGEFTETVNCQTASCPVDCVIGSWGLWSDCPKTCGYGRQKRERVPSRVAAFGGKECSQTPKQTRHCATLNCPVDCQWDIWTNWSTCTRTCGSGTRVRSRVKSVVEQSGGQICEGSNVVEDTCNTLPCPIDCKWASWEQWTPCDKTCGAGKQERGRSKLIVAEFDGVECPGTADEFRDCNTDSCPTPCTWNDWEAWSNCNKTCGGGKQERVMTIKVEGTTGDCDTNPKRESQWCNTIACDTSWALARSTYLGTSNTNRASNSSGKSLTEVNIGDLSLESSKTESGNDAGSSALWEPTALGLVVVVLGFVVLVIACRPFSKPETMK